MVMSPNMIVPSAIDFAPRAHRILTLGSGLTRRSRFCFFDSLRHEANTATRLVLSDLLPDRICNGYVLPDGLAGKRLTQHILST